MCDPHGQPQHNNSGAKRTDPLRQSYPFTNDVREIQTTGAAAGVSTAALNNVAEMTRQQLAVLGVQLDKISDPVEKSRVLEQTSFFLDPSLLPRMQYESMVLDSDQELSSEADALAMKYLSDEQLTELAKLRLSSPAGKVKRGREFDRLLGTPSGRKSTNSTMFGASHMSFASRKYLERYGLLEASGGDGLNGGTGSNSNPTGSAVKNNMQQAPPAKKQLYMTTDNNNVDLETPSGVRVKDFLLTLQENQRQLCAHDVQNDNDFGQHSAGAAQKPQDYAGVPNAQMVMTPPVGPRQRHLDRGDGTPLMPSRDAPASPHLVFNRSAPADLNDSEWHYQMFEKTSSSPHGPVQQVRAAVDQQQQRHTPNMPGQTDNVLDIERLKVLPKLL